ncbi:Heat shock factor-binding protein [Trichinella spiralis]
MNENNSSKPLGTEDLDVHPEEADHQSNEHVDERFHGESDEKTKEAMDFNSALELDDNVWNNLSNLFNEMQDRFCTMSERIMKRNILSFIYCIICFSFVSNDMAGALDDMGTRLDDLEKLINNLITQSIIEEQTEKSQAF